jgi:hypothetical protein
MRHGAQWVPYPLLCPIYYTLFDLCDASTCSNKARAHRPERKSSASAAPRRRGNSSNARARGAAALIRVC